MAAGLPHSRNTTGMAAAQQAAATPVVLASGLHSQPDHEGWLVNVTYIEWLQAGCICRAPLGLAAA